VIISKSLAAKKSYQTALYIYLQFIFLQLRTIDIVHENQQFQSVLQVDLAAYNRGREPMLILEQTMGLTEGLLRAEVPLAGRFVYDFPFFVAESVASENALAFQKRLRDELLYNLRNNPPRFVLITSEQWPRRGPGYERWDEWPEFMATLETQYSLISERHLATKLYPMRSYRLYCLKAGDACPN
jgi:hypothetical protein